MNDETPAAPVDEVVAAAAEKVAAVRKRLGNVNEGQINNLCSQFWSAESEKLYAKFVADVKAAAGL